MKVCPSLWASDDAVCLPSGSAPCCDQALLCQETRDPGWVSPELSTVLHTYWWIGVPRSRVETALTFHESLSCATPKAIFRDLCNGLLE